MLQQPSRLENKSGKIAWTRETLDRDANAEVPGCKCRSAGMRMQKCRDVNAEVIDPRLSASLATTAIHRPFLFRHYAFSKYRDVRSVGW
jgi:hypothetical protein